MRVVRLRQMQNTNHPFGPAMSASDPFGVVTIPLSERQNLCDDEAQSMRALVVEDDEKIASFVSKVSNKTVSR